ncbi:MAG: hypothetical protein H5U40_13230, partial [Polyangiaceae bacterium]|nr:hypothetical protein [Polyangiaceae bacterium]
MLFLYGTGCGNERVIPLVPPDPFVPPDPSTCAVYLWEPADGDLETWPSMDYLVEDDTTVTGYRFAMTRDRFPRLEAYGEHAHVAEVQLSTIDGFGVNASLWAEFSRPFDAARLPPGDGAVRVEDPAGIVVFAEDGSISLHPVSLSAEKDATNERRLLVAVPMRPLPEKAHAAFFVTTAAASATADHCISPSAGMRERLEFPDAETERAIVALIELGVIEDRSDLAVLQSFVTQSICDESIAVAADIASRPDADFALDIDSATDCVIDGSYRHCVARLGATDYRNAKGYVELDAAGGAIRQATYELNVHLFIPTVLSAPAPTILFGHGLSGNAVDHTRQILPFAAEDGAVIVAIDALEHGEHPTSDGVEGVRGVLEFFAVDIAGPSVDALRLRDNFRQSTFDKLQVTRAILANPDLDLDGTDDVDPERLSYVGVSLGAIMGGELLALTDVYESAILVAPGGRVSAIVNDDESVFSPLKPLLLPSAISRDDAETEKLFTVLQTALDRGDSASFAARILDQRIPSAPGVPDVLTLI